VAWTNRPWAAGDCAPDGASACVRPGESRTRRKTGEMSARPDALVSRAETGKIALRPSFPVLAGCYPACAVDNGGRRIWFAAITRRCLMGRVMRPIDAVPRPPQGHLFPSDWLGLQPTWANSPLLRKVCLQRSWRREASKWLAAKEAHSSLKRALIASISLASPCFARRTPSRPDVRKPAATRSRSNRDRAYLSRVQHFKSCRLKLSRCRSSTSESPWLIRLRW